MKKIKVKVFASLYEITLSQRPYRGDFDPENTYCKPPVILKIVPKAGYGIYTGENSEQILEIVNVFKEARRNVVFIFLFKKAAKSLKTICDCAENPDLNLEDFDKNIHLMTHSP